MARVPQNRLVLLALPSIVSDLCTKLLAVQPFGTETSRAVQGFFWHSKSPLNTSSARSKPEPFISWFPLD